MRAREGASAEGRGASRGAERPTNRLPVSHPCSVVRVRSRRYARSVWLLARARRRRRRLDVVVRQSAGVGPNTRTRRIVFRAKIPSVAAERGSFQLHASSSAFFPERRGVKTRRSRSDSADFRRNVKGERIRFRRDAFPHAYAGSDYAWRHVIRSVRRRCRDTRIPLGNRPLSEAVTLEFQRRKLLAALLRSWLSFRRKRVSLRQKELVTKARLRDVAEREGQGRALHVSCELFWIGVAKRLPVFTSLRFGVTRRGRLQTSHVRRPSRAREP